MIKKFEKYSCGAASTQYVFVEILQTITQLKEIFINIAESLQNNLEIEININQT